MTASGHERGDRKRLREWASLTGDTLPAEEAGGEEA
ncbi:uncharacterized protein NP_0496A [Natronomonas pharaonis DSM 2160]|uniref:Uncharacterized protein n=1 Tax=Natronomonas pharaonis (strain ATCC 35678 / DSM 2160 / CIP 103997 / JCM 8858 / NBRC 14720 / NCIMB 2260 / Gabara) TaxID=348780 RepID=A0A1U7ETS6_NATPD|nr:uncharacterized protein NP_0496A [Natronomonas pharaonis DSM 2160]